jgi:WD40 repeat protein
MMRFFVAAGIGCAVLCCASAGAEEVSFAKQVWPVFRQHCWSCHSGGKPEGGLRFDSQEHLLRGGETGPLVVQGKPEESLLIEQVSGDKPAMPPKRPPIGADKIALLRQWIAQGAKIDSMPVDSSLAVSIPRIYDCAPSITSVALDRDGKRAACACRSEVVVVSLADDTPPRRLPTESDLISHVEFSPDGKLLAAAGGTPALFGEVRFFDADRGTLVGSRRIGTDTLFRGCFAPDGKSIALGGADGAVYLVPVDAQAPVKRFELHSDWVLDVACTPDGTKLITASRDKTTKVASVESGQLLRTIDTSPERVNAVAADDKLAVSAGLARTVTGYELSLALQNVEVTGAGNGARPVSRREQFVRPFEVQPGEVLDLALSGDRRVLAVAGRYGDVRLYTLADRKPIAKAINVPQPVFSIALNSDGTQLIVGGKSGLLDVYQLPAGTLVKSIAPVPVRTSVAGTGR